MRMFTWFLKLYDLTAERFRSEYFSFGFTPEDFSSLEVKMSDPAMRKEVFAEMLLRTSNYIKKPKDLNKLNGLVREFQALTNHFICSSRAGEVNSTSRFLESVKMEREDAGRHLPKDLNDFIKLTYLSHKKIDQFFAKYDQTQRNAYKKVFESLKKVVSPEQLKESEIYRDYKTDERIISVAHHVLDWCMQLEPWNTYKRSPSQLAAIAICIVSRINSTVTGYIEVDTTSQELSKFGGWHSKSAVNGAAYGLYYSVLYNVLDHELLLIDPSKAPKSWKKKLKIEEHPVGKSIEDFEKSLQYLSKEELIKILDKNNFSSEEEFDILVKEMEGRGMSGRVIEVDGSPDDEQGMQLMEYISYHEKMPKYKNEIEADKGIKESIKTLKNVKSSLENRKIAIIVLAHAGRLDALSALEKFAKNTPSELSSWIFTAIGECQMFLEGKLTDTPKLKVKKMPKKK